MLADYANATGDEKLIRRKLEAIAALLADCTAEEFVFANEITAEFCRLITLLREQRQKQDSFAAQRYPEYRYQPKAHYRHGHELLCAFYDHFKKEHELPYNEIASCHFEDEADRKSKINATLLDYVARIYTFTNKYLYEVFPVEIIAAAGVFDDVLFVYDNLEIILAKFNTKDENGNSIKQRLNLRSALRKLNEFKCASEIPY